MSEFKNLSVILPAMDETYSLKETVDTIMETNSVRDIAEIIFVFCDRTAAETRAVADKLIEKYGSKLPVYVHEQTLPFVGGAVREGIELARGSHLVLMSSDLETPPELIAQFISLAREHPEHIITASRWRKGGGFSNYNKVKLVCNFIFERLIALLYFSKLTDLTYAYRIFPSELMKKIQWEELKHPFFLETALKPLRLGVRFIEIPAHWTARTEGVSQNSFWANFRYFKTALHNRFMKKSDILIMMGETAHPGEE